MCCGGLRDRRGCWALLTPALASTEAGIGVTSNLRVRWRRRARNAPCVRTSRFRRRLPSPRFPAPRFAAFLDGDQRAIASYQWDSAAGTANLLTPIHSNAATLDDAWAGVFGSFTAEEHRQAFRGPPVQTLCGSFRSTDAGPRKLARATGGADWILLAALDTDGRGEILGCGVPRRIALTRGTTRVLENVVAHLTATARIRRMRGATDAVFAPSGGVLHAETRAQSDLEPLRAMVKRAESARSRKSSADEALAGWTAVVQARWSLVDQFESDGRRFVVARENEPRASYCCEPTGRGVPQARCPWALSAREPLRDPSAPRYPRPLMGAHHLPGQ